MVNIENNLENNKKDLLFRKTSQKCLFLVVCRMKFLLKITQTITSPVPKQFFPVLAVII